MYVYNCRAFSHRFSNRYTHFFFCCHNCRLFSNVPPVRRIIHKIDHLAALHDWPSWSVKQLYYTTVLWVCVSFCLPLYRRNKTYFCYVETPGGYWTIRYIRPFEYWTKCPLFFSCYWRKHFHTWFLVEKNQRKRCQVFRATTLPQRKLELKWSGSTTKSDNFSFFIVILIVIVG